MSNIPTNIHPSKALSLPSLTTLNQGILGISPIFIHETNIFLFILPSLYIRHHYLSRSTIFQTKSKSFHSDSHFQSSIKSVIHKKRQSPHRLYRMEHQSQQRLHQFSVNQKIQANAQKNRHLDD